jgi:hypothetical protein
MAITSADLSQEGTGLSGSGLSAANARRTYHANYVVVTDDPTTSPKAVEAHFKATTSLPWYGRTWKWSGTAADRDTTAICNKFEVTYRPRSAGVFDVRVQFEPQDKENQQQKPDTNGDLTDDPLLWIEEIVVNYTQLVIPSEKAIFRGFDPPNIVNPFLADGDKLPPCNSALVTFDPAPERIVPIKVVRFVRWVPSLIAAEEYQGTINNDEYTINKLIPYNFRQVVPKYHGLIKNVGGHVEYINRRFLWKREIELWINPLSWIDQYLDEGDMTRRKPGDPKPGGGTWSLTDFAVGEPFVARMRDHRGQVITKPTNLNGNGLPLEDPKKPVYLKWQNYDDKPHANFPW